MKKLGILAAFFVLPVAAQFTSTARHVGGGSSLPATCRPGPNGDVFWLYSAGPQTGRLYVCSAINVWSVAGGTVASGAGVPAGTCDSSTAGEFYRDSTAKDIWWCDGTAWQRLFSTTGSGAYSVTGQAGSTPATPDAGNVTEYFDSTAKLPQSVDDAGAKATMVRPNACAGQVVQSVGTNGSITCGAGGGGTGPGVFVYSTAAYGSFGNTKEPVTFDTAEWDTSSGALFSVTAGVISAGVYTSGITATGSAGQTCTLGSFNGGGASGAATVALTGTNAITAGTHLTITAGGTGYTSAPTSATASNGTATCSGTATVATALNSAAIATSAGKWLARCHNGGATTGYSPEIGFFLNGSTSIFYANAVFGTPNSVTYGAGETSRTFDLAQGDWVQCVLHYPSASDTPLAGQAGMTMEFRKAF